MKVENFQAMLAEIQRERGIPKEALIEAIKASLLSAAKKIFKEEEHPMLDAQITDDGAFKIVKKDENGKEKDVTPKDFGRIAAQTAKQVIIQRIREAEKEEIYEEFVKKQGQIINGIVQRAEYGGYLVNVGKIETVLSAAEQIPGEYLGEKERVKLYVVEVHKATKGPQVIISRAHAGLVKKLFEMEIPEIADGTLEIKGIAREPGRRTKIAIQSHDEKVGAVGTCVGHMGARIQNIIKELGQERVDIIEWKEKPAAFITAALSPAKIASIEINEEEKTAKVYVPDNDLSLAIGKEGQNVRLAVKLTGWKIDIMSEEEGKRRQQKVEEGKEEAVEVKEEKSEGETEKE